MPMPPFQGSITALITPFENGAVDAKTAVARYVAAWIGPAAALVAYAALQPANLGAHAAWRSRISGPEAIERPREAAAPDSDAESDCGGARATRASACA